MKRFCFYIAFLAAGLILGTQQIFADNNSWKSFSFGNKLAEISVDIDSEQGYFVLKNFRQAAKKLTVVQSYILAGEKAYYFKDGIWNCLDPSDSSLIPLGSPGSFEKIEKDCGLFSEAARGDLSRLKTYPFVNEEKVFVPLSCDLGFCVKGARLVAICSPSAGTYFSVVFKMDGKILDAENGLFSLYNDQNERHKKIFDKTITDWGKEAKENAEDELSFGAEEQTSGEEKASSKENTKEQIEFIDILKVLVYRSVMHSSVSSDGIYILSSYSEESAGGYLRAYLSYLLENNYPVFSGLISLYDENTFSAQEYICLSETESNSFAEAALRYLDWCVEYTNPRDRTDVYDKPLFDKVDKSWSNYSGSAKNNFWTDGEFPGGGNPMPYAALGIDTPRTFWCKMRRNKELSSSVKTNKKFYYGKTSYLPMDLSKTMRGAGTDSAGLVSGALSMSGAAEKIYGFERKRPAKWMMEYSRDLFSLSQEDINTPIGSSREKNIFTAKDLERATCVVPSCNELRKGDILVLYRAETHPLYAIVVDVNGKTRSGVTVVYMSETRNGTARKSLWSELPDSGSYIARRFIRKRNNSEQNPEYTPLDFIDSFPVKAEVSIKKLKEQSQSSDARWKWIPNTGEYLFADGISFELRNRAGAKIIYSDYEYEVSLSAKDRNFFFQSNYDRGYNVENNSTGSSFLLALLAGREIIEYGNLVADGKGAYVFQKTYSGHERLFLSSAGTLLLKKQDGSSLSVTGLGIRPLSSKSAAPGDDIYLSFKFVHKSDNFSDKEIVVEAQCSEADYLCAYDKKMLWRANLYLNQKYDNNEDWNAEHPWDAPLGNSFIKESEKSWWNKEWGFNEWNREYGSCDKYDIAVSKGNRGNGGQVVYFDEFTSERDDKKTSKKLNTVSYDYPINRDETGIKKNTDQKNIPINAWDSPFDFAYKIKAQRIAMRTHFSQIIVSKEDALDQVKNPGKGKDVYNTSICNLPESPAVFPISEGNNYSVNTPTNKALSVYESTTAPLDKWKLYWRDNKETVNGKSIEPFIPGLGFWEHENFIRIPTPENPEPENSLDKEVRYYSDNLKNSYIKAYKFPAYKSAGTDCLGFAVRAAAYNGSRYSFLANQNIITDRSENSSVDPDSVERKLSFPVFIFEPDKNVKPNSCEIVNWMDLFLPGDFKDSSYFTALPKAGPLVTDDAGKYCSPEKLEAFRKKMMLVIPGDVITYGENLSRKKTKAEKENDTNPVKSDILFFSNAKDTKRTGNHIGIINSVDTERMRSAKTLEEILSCVRVIESTYNGKICEVLVQNMKQWYARGSCTYRSFSIQRLGVSE